MMTKTPAELLPCPHCASKNVSVRKHGAFKVYCHDCSGSYLSEESAIAAWNVRANKEAGFLEELKKYINGAQLPYYESADLDNTNTELISELKILLEKIEKFQAEQKQVSDNNHKAKED